MDDDMRTRHRGRRQNKTMPRVPFRDSTGVIIRECRRKTPDRRIGNIVVEWLSDAVHW